MKQKIQVTAETRLADVWDAYPWLPDALIAMDPAFKKIKNPAVKMMIRRSTVADAARYAKCTPETLIGQLDEILAAREE